MIKKNKTKLQPHVRNSKSIIQKGIMQLRRAKNSRLLSIQRRSTMLRKSIRALVALMEGVGTKGVSQLYHLSFDDNKVLKIINWIC